MERSELVLQENIDLIICPCTVFDESCNRMGMGGGYYDRYLPKCKNAVVAAAAFEVQKAEQVPMEPWDKAVDLVFTEKKTYFKK
jgi:5-formyltetrahydrofolate cyclo-ligase